MPSLSDAHLGPLGAVSQRRAVIVGTGLIGGSIGLALRKEGWYVTGRDLDPERAARGLRPGALCAVGAGPFPPTPLIPHTNTTTGTTRTCAGSRTPPARPVTHRAADPQADVRRPHSHIRQTFAANWCRYRANVA